MKIKRWIYFLVYILQPFGILIVGLYEIFYFFYKFSFKKLIKWLNEEVEA